jgi:hypothetical protein
MSPSEAQRRWPDIAGRMVEHAAGRRHVLPIRVYFEDTDSQGALGVSEVMPSCPEKPKGSSAIRHSQGVEHMFHFLHLGLVQRVSERQARKRWHFRGTQRWPPTGEM